MPNPSFDWHGLQGLEPVVRALDAPLFTVGGVEMSVVSLLKILLWVAFIYWLAGQSKRWFVQRQLHHLDAGTSEAIGAILRYVVLILGLALVLQNAGIQLAALGVVAGAVGVGVGFGLQNVISNFICGLIILVERPIKVGDLVEIGGLEGRVQQIGARRVTVVTHDNVAILVPNQRFITENVVNLVYEHGPRRLRIPFGVASPDAETVIAVVGDAVRAVDGVLAQPAPAVRITGLNAGGMGFEVAVWTQRLGAERQPLESALRRAIAAALAAHQLPLSG
ncbi:MAG: mechanosensitive ion channel [Burkholderiaceae bacterium]